MPAETKLLWWIVDVHVLHHSMGLNGLEIACVYEGFYGDHKKHFTFIDALSAE